MDGTVVELDGDEITRIIPKLIKDTLILYLTSTWSTTTSESNIATPPTTR